MMSLGCNEHIRLTRKAVSRAASTILLLFQSAYVLRTKNAGCESYEQYASVMGEEEIHSEQTIDNRLKAVKVKR